MNLFRSKKKSLADFLQKHDETFSEMKESYDSAPVEDKLVDDDDDEVTTPTTSSLTSSLKQELVEEVQARPRTEDRVPSAPVRTLTEQDIFRPSQPMKPRPVQVPVSSAPTLQPQSFNGTVISSGVTFRGELFGTENIMILGRFEGRIHLEGHLEIGEKGEIQANVKATSLKVSGKVEGNLVATERLELASTAKVLGDIVCPRLSMNDGASFKGRVSMNMEEAQTTFEAKVNSTQKDTRPAGVLPQRPVQQNSVLPEKRDQTVILGANPTKPVKKFEPNEDELDDGISSALILGK